MRETVCVITGVGPGTGAALVRKFSERYRIAMIARDEERLEALATAVPGAMPFSCDVSDREALAATIGEINSLGDTQVVVHNAVGGGAGDVLSLDPDLLEHNFRVNTTALLQLVQSFGPAMVEAGRGAILATGNTAAYRGRANFASFAPTKAAQRILLESAARLLGPKGVHVAYVAIDAAIDVPWTRKMLPDHADDFFANPDDIAAECFHIAHQPQSSWTFDVVIRPFGESW
ncbi:SDR family NAD(P)-dependent oxidoreductase [Candidatus Marimicrobium litorale]|uniref:SDR family NAD(P)-dependent oxidoreductase n=1 Tax=Candidatus Marimicrobium litorale TaxID=2518991 RepID=A0ABT3T2Q9_9GAMM|nr:SDR family NAD(P)-dependent oxidoreductase [Candidatus Marimicrobium litorale]MCX2976126.1 SDR family NAD(P)-dependent oxidoreductase [Candidatus Marimicrobium litorale]